MAELNVYSKAKVDELLGTKQASGDYLTTTTASSTYQTKLTAGANITITDGTISASQKTYTGSTNISVSDAGVISATGLATTTDLNSYVKSADKLTLTIEGTTSEGTTTYDVYGAVSATTSTTTA